jgi:phenylpropionate dioxygenase-like ring-hydroxylating dioxygenase large terminal subunit
MPDDAKPLPDYLKLFARLVADPDMRCMPLGAPVTAIDPKRYVDPAQLAAERETLFRRYPVPVAHVSELPEAGSVLAHDHLGVPILLTRGRDGEIRAFLNACRHRNTKLVEPAESGRRASIVCRYHAWAYGHDGALLNIPCQDQFPGVDRKDKSLVPLPSAVRAGLIFVTPDPQGRIDIDRHLLSLAEDLEAFGVGTSVVFKKVEQIKRFNWKLVVDAFTDGYHIQYLHRHTIAPFFKENCSASERVGDHLRAVVARLPFDEARRLSPAQWDIRQHATYSHYVFPNMVTIMHPDYVSLISLYPRAPGETTYVHTLLTPHAPRDEKERAHYERSFDLIENGVFQAEDLNVSERAQAAFEGGALWPMTLGAMEQSIAEFHRIVDEAVARR